jgi:hypothetical protein
MDSRKTDSEKTGNKKTDFEKTDSKKTRGQKPDAKKSGNQKPRSHHSAAERSKKQILPAHRRRCIIIKDPKHRGEWTELVFMSRITERGFNVSKPWGDSSRYDCAVERRGHFLRVQVKSTIARQFNGYIVTIKSGYHYYTRHQVDFFAVYVIPEDVWYILPAKIITILRSNFLLAPRRPHQKYAAYKEAWHLLKAGCHTASRRPATPAAKRRKNAAHDASRG